MSKHTELIWRDFRKQLKAYIATHISDPTLVEDLLQEVFLKIHAKIDTLQDQTKIQSWVYQITRNTLIDYYRKPKITSVNFETIPSETHAIQPEMGESAAENPAQEIAAGLQGMVAELPEKYAQALQFVEFQGGTQIDLAAHLGISVSGAKSRVQRARRMLRDQLMHCCHFEFDRYGTILDVYPACCCCCCSKN
jgi:RNA polymerase sigma-70 factor, ECF subfamily